MSTTYPDIVKTNYSLGNIVLDDFFDYRMDDHLQQSYSDNVDDNSSLTATLHNIRALFNSDNYPQSYKATLTRRTTLILVSFFTIVIVSLFGNLLVCYVVFKRKRMRISTNLLMTNLALSDLLMTVINIPFNIARILLDEWPFGSILCVLVPLVQVTSVYVSTLTMTIIAIDRYQAIMNPLHKRITTSLPTTVTILLIWLAAALFSIPNVAFNHVVEIAGHTNLHRCRAIYPTPELKYRRYVTLFTFLTQYAIPLSITTFAYIRISFYIWNKLSTTHTNTSGDCQMMNGTNGPSRSNDSIDNSVPSTMINSNHKNNNNNNGSNNNIIFNNKNGFSYQTSVNQLRERSRRKSIKMLALVVGVFSICWLPLNIFHLNADFSPNNRISDPNVFFICYWFAMSSVCYNPFIYFWLNRHYRQEIKHLIRCTNVFSSGNRASSPMINAVMKQQQQMQRIHFSPDIMHHHPHHHPKHSVVSFGSQQESQKRNKIIQHHHFSPAGIRSCYQNHNNKNNNNNNNICNDGNDNYDNNHNFVKNHHHNHHHNHNDGKNATSYKIVFRTRFNGCPTQPTTNHQQQRNIMSPISEPMNGQLNHITISNSNPLNRSNLSLHFKCDHEAL